MHAVTLRRLLVLGVCAAGVGCLYLVPGVARAPQQSAGPLPHDGRTASPVQRVEDTAATASASRTTGPQATATSDPGGVAAEPTVTDPAETPVPRTPPTGATAFDPAATPDDVAPAAVPVVRTATVTSSRLTLSWPAASDNVGVVRYEVVLNGFEVASTAHTHATIPWFNDDARDHVVQVRAVDAAGNEGPSSPNLLVARPTPGPTPGLTPTPEPSPSPRPSPADPTVMASPSPSPTPSPPASTEAPRADVAPQASPTTQEN